VLDNDIINDTILPVTKIRDILVQMQQNLRDVRFNDLCRVCDIPSETSAIGH
jgi:hypothetical protein